MAMKPPTTPIESELRRAHSAYANAKVHGKTTAEREELGRQVQVLRVLNALDKGLAEIEFTHADRGRFIALIADKPIRVAEDATAAA